MSCDVWPTWQNVSFIRLLYIVIAAVRGWQGLRRGNFCKIFSDRWHFVKSRLPVTCDWQIDQKSIVSHIRSNKLNSVLLTCIYCHWSWLATTETDFLLETVIDLILGQSLNIVTGNSLFPRSVLLTPDMKSAKESKSQVRLLMKQGFKKQNHLKFMIWV